MIQIGRKTRYGAGALALMTAVFVFVQASQTHSNAAGAQSLNIPLTQAYAPQKVVYHINAGGGWFGHDHIQRLQNMENHLNALQPGDLQLSVVLQGNGLDLLTDAAKDKVLASRIATLRDRGVKFLICRNTLVSKNLGIEKLDGVTASDVVGAGVAEVTRLQSLGYAYLRL